MAKTTAYAGQLLNLYFDAVAIANVADNAASSPLTNIQVALHTADPGLAGTQATNEVAYTSYARVAVARGSGGWTQSTNQVSNTAAITFPKATGVSDSSLASYWSVGDAASGAGVLRYSGPLATLLGPATAIASSDTLFFGAAALAAVTVGSQIVFIAAPNGVTPGGIAISTTYYAKTVPTTDTMTLSATSGGATLDITTDGSGYWALLSPLLITQNVQPIVNIGQMVIQEY
jgi:hypothetical protein